MARRLRTSAFQLRMSGLRDTVHRRDEPLPSRSLACEHPSSGGGDAVIASPPLTGLFDPAARDPATLLESIEQRIQRRDPESDRSLGLLLDDLADFVSMTRAMFDERQNQQLGTAFLQLAIENPVYILHSDILQ